MTLTTGCHILLNDNDGARDIFLLHTLAINLDLFDGHLLVLREEDEHLVSRIVRVAGYNRQVLSRGLSFTRTVAKHRLEFLQSLVQLALLVRKTQLLYRQYWL